MVRLCGPAEAIEQRLRLRHEARPDELAWHLARRVELDSILDAACVADADVSIGERTPHEIATELLQLIEW